MRLLLFGGTGQVGTELRAVARARGVEIVAPPRSVLDLNDANAIAKMVEAYPWRVVINAAGYTAVDRAESEEATAWAINGKGAGTIAAATAAREIPVIHISTDYVFDGRKGAPYVESDNTAPVNAYGRSKLAGERAVRAANPRHFIVRTAWVYSLYGSNFVRTVLRLAGERDRLTIVADQRGCPTAACDIASACLQIAQRCVAEPGGAVSGTYHFAGGGEASWFEFASAIIELAGDRLNRVPEIVPITTMDYPTPALRPADTRLDCTAVVREFGVALRPWRAALAETLDRLLTSKETL